MTFESKIAFLTEHGAQQNPHGTATLLDHLIATSQILEAWGMDVALQDAGLFHSVYSTESYTNQLLPVSMRSAVCALIGSEAEHLAFLFSTMSRGSFFLNVYKDDNFTLKCRRTGQALSLCEREMTQLCHLVAANWLEQHHSLPIERRYTRRAELTAMVRFLTPSACKAIKEALNDSQGRKVTYDGVLSQKRTNNSNNDNILPYLPEMLQWKTNKYLLESCVCLNKLHLRMIAEALSSGISPADAAVIEELGALPDFSYMRIMTAPELFGRVVCVSGESPDGRSLPEFLREVIAAERARLDANWRITCGMWSALGDCYFPPQPAVERSAANQVRNAAEQAQSAGIDQAVRALHVGEPTGFLDSTVVDLSSPFALRVLPVAEWRSYQYGPAEPFFPEERKIVLERITQAFQSIREISPEAYQFVIQNLRVIVPRKYSRNRFFKGSSSRMFIGRANIHNPHVDYIDKTHIAQSIVHESIHNYLYKIEGQTSFLVGQSTTGLGDVFIASPWSGTELPIGALIHSIIVWFGLMCLFYNRRSSQFLTPQSVDYYKKRSVMGFKENRVTRSLTPYRGMIRPDLYEQLVAMEALAMELDNAC